jgi:hypothetical protein
LAADAALRASRKSKPGEAAASGSPSSGGAEKSPTKEASVDAINHQLQRIEDLRRKFEREDSLILELAPAVDVADQDNSAEPALTPIATKSKGRVVLVSGALTAAAALLAGLWWLLRGF